MAINGNRLPRKWEKLFARNHRHREMTDKEWEDLKKQNQIYRSKKKNDKR